MKKRFAVLTLALALILTLTACGGSGDSKTLKIGATPAPHAEILEQAKELMEKEGYTLEIVEFEDYVTPNTALEEGELDANYFQHVTYMNGFNDERGTHLVSAAAIHYEPLGLYAGTSASLAELPDGAKIAVPNDATNEARALLLLEQAGLLTLKEGVGIAATKDDIVDNPHNYEIYEVEARLTPTVLEDVAIAVVNGNYAIDAGLKVADALAVEASDGAAADAYANIITVTEGNEKNEAVLALIEVLKSDTIKAFIEETYEGAVVPLF